MSKIHLDLENVLNPEQYRAATHGDGPQLVIAGAGSGKTRVITHRVAWLIEEQGVDPRHIVAVTFTNKAAAEMRERVEELLHRYPLPTFLGTFHRYCLRLLRRYGERVGLRNDFTILDTNDQLALIKEALGLEGYSEKAFPPRAVLAEISGAKNRLQTPADYERDADGFFQRRVVQIYRRYQGLLQRSAGVDFDDMIAYAVRFLEQDSPASDRLRERVEYLLVDEFQDTNHAQLRLVQALASPQVNLTAVGDEDQGIYRWRGADLDNILQFEDVFPGATIRKLEQNYRSTQTILDASGALIANNVGRRGKKLWTEGAVGEPIRLYRASDELDEARWLVGALQDLRGTCSLASMAILVRTNAQTRALEEELNRRGVAYQLIGGTRFYDRAEIKDLIAYLRVLRNPHDDYSLNRILNQPPRGIGAATEQLLRDRAKELKQPVWDVLDLDDFGSFPRRAGIALRKFRDLIRSLRKLSADLPLPSLLDQLLAATQYKELYNRENPEGQARLENIAEFLSAAQEFTEQNSYQSEQDDLLTGFLDHVSLVADVDSLQGGGGVKLMTLHSAKGLEFPVVALSGLEDGLLPHFNAQGSQADVEEERRLLYVGMTRAKERLLLSCCRRRRIAGRYQDQDESPFLAQLPEEHLDATLSPAMFERRSQNVYSFFGRDRERSGRSPEDEPQWAPAEDPVYDPDAGTPSIRRGGRVQHPTLGQGTVLQMSGTGDSAKLVVIFDRVGRRKLVAKYANLEALD